ncbi:uncharacterized protein IAS62_005474 [Cryptococcus decagattii]|uniref:Uncharacterized protein n=1 Tax=Cryptococcus decagattii TaxID=1859122 RepID=A0ABZ2AZZ8_9TREE
MTKTSFGPGSVAQLIVSSAIDNEYDKKFDFPYNLQCPLLPPTPDASLRAFIYYPRKLSGWRQMQPLDERSSASLLQ